MNLKIQMVILTYIWHFLLGIFVMGTPHSIILKNQNELENILFS